MRGQPPNTFKQYPEINEAYAEMRRHFLFRLEQWNGENPDNRVSQVDTPLLEFIRSCIPSELDPPPLGPDANGIRERIRAILYPFIESGQIDPEVFATRIKDHARMMNFLEEWLVEKGSRRKSGPQPKPRIIDLIDAGLIPRYSAVRLRYEGESYDGHLTANGFIDINLGEGIERFKSPNQVFMHGLKVRGDRVWEQFYLVGPDETGTRLADLRAEYLKTKQYDKGGKFIK